MAALDTQKYTPAEEAEIQTWLDKATSLKVAASDALLDTLNTDLATRTTAIGTKPSKADVALYESLAPLVKAWTPEQRTGEQGRPNIVRLVDFVQNSPLFSLNIADADKVQVDAEEILYRRRSRRRTMVVEAVAGEGAAKKQKKEKKERAPRQPAPPPAPTVMSPCLIDLRVGHILKAIKHPEADSLYVSTIAMGDAPGIDDTTYVDVQVVRTVCSGLNGLVPLEEMQGRKVVVVCNLKPVKMRGIKSSAMVLAASPKIKEGEADDHKGPVELVNPPADAKAGERVYFEGWQGEPEKVLNPKKKIWETFQPGFTTTDTLEVAFDAGVVEALEGKTGLGKLVTASGGVCKVASLQGAQLVHTTGNFSVGLPLWRWRMILDLKISSRCCGVPWYMTTGIEGTHWWNSSSQLDKVLKGATMSFESPVGRLLGHTQPHLVSQDPAHALDTNLQVGLVPQPRQVDGSAGGRVTGSMPWPAGAAELRWGVKVSVLCVRELEESVVVMPLPDAQQPKEDEGVGE
ncbi:hypothetical protein CHGG_04341 [Chaetomium globosum CBS 148.51]|uniref:tRNA-binding domain-containing protein n=1 Tax=Chaetomium globosum (strain ATCC 6205 / CBS 148.51 / DSM 1962 / NBRC 6347 / NRRL 1970) TaxID=306901 RepID=Q2H1K5_CHAGB|nr:uncharacterized protein CHGG_04341 [Chaetomium globosum CBS 148.51]EAQ87722.1 hypothetical protein CHGG_04341 [Chaetomium globosum CBS 148.51]